MYMNSNNNQPPNKYDLIRKKSNLLYIHEIEDLDMGNCPICYEKIKMFTFDEENDEIKPKPNVINTPCGHSFCYECLSKHLEKKKQRTR